jgi:hypothetical protein
MTVFGQGPFFIFGKNSLKFKNVVMPLQFMNVVMPLQFKNVVKPLQFTATHTTELST